MSKKYEKVFKEKPIPGIGHPTGILLLIDEKNLIDDEKGLDEKGLYKYEFSCLLGIILSNCLSPRIKSYEKYFLYIGIIICCAYICSR